MFLLTCLLWRLGHQSGWGTGFDRRSFHFTPSRHTRGRRNWPWQGLLKRIIDHGITLFCVLKFETLRSTINLLIPKYAKNARMDSCVCAPVSAGDGFGSSPGFASPTGRVAGEVEGSNAISSWVSVACHAGIEGECKGNFIEPDDLNPFIYIYIYEPIYGLYRAIPGWSSIYIYIYLYQTPTVQLQSLKAKPAASLLWTSPCPELQLRVHFGLSRHPGDTDWVNIWFGDEQKYTSKGLHICLDMFGIYKSDLCSIWANIYAWTTYDHIDWSMYIDGSRGICI